MSTLLPPTFVLVVIRSSRKTPGTRRLDLEAVGHAIAESERGFDEVAIRILGFDHADQHGLDDFGAAEGEAIDPRMRVGC